MTIFDELLAAGLPVISADESGAISMGEMTDAQKDIFKDVVLAHFNPIDWEQVQQNRIDKAQLKSEFQSIIDTLVQIENATSPTNAQVVAAVKFLARALRLLLRLLARIV